MEKILRVRRFIMQRAQSLLMGGATVSETAEQLGFDYPQHFTRLFKKHFGVTPSTFVRGEMRIILATNENKYYSNS